MRQQILRLVCDDCGITESFETVNVGYAPIVATPNVEASIKRHGWESITVEGGSSFGGHDRCWACAIIAGGGSPRSHEKE